MVVKLMILLSCHLALGAADGCQDGWKQFKTSCYLFHDVVNTFYVHRDHCKSLGATLSSIHNQDEQNFIDAWMKSLDDKQDWPYIGIARNTGRSSWYWQDRSGVKFTSWAPGRPNKGETNCVYLDALGWINNSCYTKKTGLCKKSCPSCTESTSSTIATTVTTSQATDVQDRASTCKDLTRNGCQMGQLSPLKSLSVADPHGCHKLCSTAFNQTCKFITYNVPLMTCNIYTTEIETFKESCETTAEPFSLCSQTLPFCQNVFWSSCNECGEPLVEVPNVSSHEDCRTLCSVDMSCNYFEYVQDESKCKIFFKGCSYLVSGSGGRLEDCLDTSRLSAMIEIRRKKVCEILTVP